MTTKGQPSSISDAANNQSVKVVVADRKTAVLVGVFFIYGSCLIRSILPYRLIPVWAF